MKRPLSASLESIGVLGPGLSDWSQARAVLRAERPYHREATQIPPATALPPAERRRTGKVVHLALAVGQQAVADGLTPLSSLITVFASSGADSENCHEILCTLASQERQLSPTRFHNSVHNLTAGYWSIATRDMAPYTVVCAYEGSFAAGLFEAVCQVVTSGRQVLLIAYDVGYPPPLQAKRPLGDPFAVAMLLSPRAGQQSMGSLLLQYDQGACHEMADSEFEKLRRSTPAARALSLLERVACARAGTTLLEYLDAGSLAVEYTP